MAREFAPGELEMKIDQVMPVIHLDAPGKKLEPLVRYRRYPMKTAVQYLGMSQRSMKRDIADGRHAYFTRDGGRIYFLGEDIARLYVEGKGEKGAVRRAPKRSGEPG